jgi:hypothetical protein
MAMTFIGALNVASAGREEAHRDDAALGCNRLGLTDAIMYVVAMLTNARARMLGGRPRMRRACTPMT